jgi:response regulator NasT
MLEILAEYLESEGYCVVGKAQNGAEACELSRELKPDAAIFDLDMPEMDGVQAAKHIMEENPLPIVMITGYTGADLTARIADSGVFGCLTKPIDLDELSQLLRIALSRFEEMRRLRLEVAELGQALEARKWIEKAKGIVMGARNLTENQAHHYLQMESQRQCRPVVELARAIVTANEVTKIAVLGNTGRTQSSAVCTHGRK